ncbi:hypothetical protein [Vreelandella titanicae]|uniref:hypothetical protein n=1 Tax=Vreelandella titanicae TaxID=664683 RepID=UPI001CC25A7A|nr:hypothetical protein [Halomonas titanicae]
MLTILSNTLNKRQALFVAFGSAHVVLPSVKVGIEFIMVAHHALHFLGLQLVTEAGAIIKVGRVTGSWAVFSPNQSPILLMAISVAN